MPILPTCYVATPFGLKTNRDTSRIVDYDDVYSRAIKPAVEIAGYEAVRADEVFSTSGGIFQKTILELSIFSELFIANLGDNNPNVMYELGVRHAARRGPAILLALAGNHVPFDISYARVLQYNVDHSGRLSPEEADRLRELLQLSIQQASREQRNDSPVYMLACSKGIAIVESKHSKELNPNVTMEWGWLRSTEREVLYLVEKDFDLQRADISGLIKDQFDWKDPEPGIKLAVQTFLKP